MEKIKRSFLHFAEEAEFLCVLILAFFKTYYLYKEIHMGRLWVFFSFLTLAILALFWFLSRFFCKARPTLLFALYAVLSVILLIDSVYYAYVSKLPSVISLKYAKQLTDVSNTVLSLVTPARLLYVADLPLWLIYFINFRKSEVKKPKGSGWGFALYILLSCIFMASSAFCLPDFNVKYYKNEIFTYHTSDIASVVFGSSLQSSGKANTGLDYENIEKSELWGVCRGRNVIVIQVEAMQNFVIGREYNGQQITPNINRLLQNDCAYFDNYYYQIGGGNTSDAEFTAMTSLYAPESEAAFEKYTDKEFYALPKLLKDNGYSAAVAFHGYKKDFWNRDEAYKTLGFDRFYSEEDFDSADRINLGVSDKSFFEQTANYLSGCDEPFYAHIVTLSSHHPYNLPKDKCTLELSGQDKNTLYGDYLQSMRYVDESIGEFLEELDSVGILENSVIAIYGDHFGLPHYDKESSQFMMNYLQKSYGFDEVFNVPLILYAKNSGIGGKKISTSGGHIDFMPTLLHLCGIKNEKAVMFGHDLFYETSGIVYEQTHLSRGSFISDDVIFWYPTNGIISESSTFLKKTLEIVDSKVYYDIVEEAKNTINECEYMIENNLVILTEK
ncbi:MAG: sulfatase-like hydrolase/transferase [Clostridia bacterium]|nr:sulfatase-like hydrolase/transferase [Clostridia bacterium]